MKNWVILGLCFLLFSSIFAVGCNKEKMAVATYEGVGQVLIEFKSEVELKYKAGEVNEEFYNKAKNAYNKARASYILAGDTLALIIELEDAIQRQALFSESLKHLDEAKNIITSVLAILESNGIKFEKVSALIEKFKS